MVIPKDVKHFFGNKTKFHKTTGCKFDQIKLAEIQAKKMVYEWKSLIKQARSNSSDPIFNDAIALRRYIKEYESYDKTNLPKDFPKELDIELFKDQVLDSVAEEISEIERKSGTEVAKDVSNVAFGKRRYLKNLIDDWEKNELLRRLEPKTVDGRKSNINLICKTFPTIDRFFKEDSVKNWLNSLHSSGQYTASRIGKICDAGKSFYNYLDDIGEFKELRTSQSISNPFIVPKQLRIGKNRKSKQQYFKKEWIPFTTDEVICCYQTVLDKGEDQQLLDLIQIGAYTGMRIEEICSLKIEEIDMKKGSIQVTDSKTISGIREVPIHSKLIPRIKKLIKDSEDGYLISGLTFNKYKDRSNAIGKRFGRLKKSLGFESLKVFHSIRKTVATTFENHQVLENIVADIIGHDKPRMTYGIYSSGTNLIIKKQKIELLNYDWAKKVKSPNQLLLDKEKKELIRLKKRKIS
jgi:integrase